MTARPPAVGAEVLSDGGVRFRVWAPKRRRVAVLIDGRGEHPLAADGDGYFAATVPDLRAGARYRYRLDDDSTAYPDPASRYQPEGPHGPSEVVDPSRFRWTDAGWKGVTLAGQVLYEMHVGTFTKEGTYAAAAREFKELAACGITCLEVMPVNEFPGRFGWGYDGVNLYAPSHLYGTPDDFRAFVDAAHAAGLGVILDVVYNHLGPDGNYLGQFADAYFTDRYKTEWGAAINFDGDDSGPVRDFFAGNAAYWIREFHLDGLRLDATQNVYDTAPPDRHILTEIGRRARAAAGSRSIIIVNENEPQHSELCRPIDQGGYGLDALWNDDFHHSATVALTGRNEAYYTDYLGDPQEFVSAVKYGYLYHGQWYSWQEKRRGRPGFDLPPAAFVTFTQNHDQVANSGRGLRCHQLTSPGRYRAMTALTLLAPGTPMLFQGQEFASSAPFFYFADHGPELAKLVEAGRAEFLQQFRSLKDPAMRPVFAPPHEMSTFERCKLDFAERERHAPAYQLVKDLLRLRREDPAFRAQRPRGVDGAVLGPQAFVLRYFTDDGLDRLLVVNFGRDLHLLTCPEPLLAPPRGMRWAVALSTEEPKYGGTGAQPAETADCGWRVAGEAAVVLVPESDGEVELMSGHGRFGGGAKRIVY
jgi:maltooligosyltrehalose trehalohydrolase